MMMIERETPEHWKWAYHITSKTNIDSIVKGGLQPTFHPHVSDIPVIFAEPDLEGVMPYYEKGTVILRFKTPGLGTTEDGETVIFGGSEGGGEPDLPLVGKEGEDGVIPPERIQFLAGNKFDWLLV